MREYPSAEPRAGVGAAADAKAESPRATDARQVPRREPARDSPRPRDAVGDSSPAQASPAGDAAKGAASTPPTAAGAAPRADRPPQRLKALQQAQCADAEFLGRFVCNERVRLRFCRDRWNEHEDCRVDQASAER
jgi:hypothetical protein